MHFSHYVLFIGVSYWKRIDMQCFVRVGMYSISKEKARSEVKKKQCAFSAKSRNEIFETVRFRHGNRHRWFEWLCNSTLPHNRRAFVQVQVRCEDDPAAATAKFKNRATVTPATRRGCTAAGGGYRWYRGLTGPGVCGAGVCGAGVARRRGETRALATVGSQRVEEDAEKEQMPLLLQVSSFVTLHLRSREFSMNLSEYPPYISFARRAISISFFWIDLLPDKLKKREIYIPARFGHCVVSFFSFLIFFF